MPDRLAAVLLSLALPVLIGASCPRGKPEDCAHSSSERCLWEQGVAGGPVGSDEGELGNEREPGSEPTAIDQSELERTMGEIVQIMRVGLEWRLVDQRARELCRGRDEDGALLPAEITVAEDAWSCPVAGLEIDGQVLQLEASEGVISLTADELPGLRSEALAEAARELFEGRCADGFEELEGGKRETYYRCPLPEGPYLVVARIPRDLEADRWQLTIAVVDAG